MALPLIIPVAAKLFALTAAATGAGALVKGRVGTQNDAQDAYRSYSKALESNGLTDLNLEDVVGRMYSEGALDRSEYSKSLSLLKEYDSTFSKSNGWDDFWQSLGHTKATHSDTAKLFNKITAYIPEISNVAYTAANYLPEDIKKAFYTNLPKVTGAPAPNYLDTSFDINQREVDPVKLWSGQEMADLHSLDYDVNNMYDLVKARTGAQVDLGQFKSAYANNTAGLTNTQERVGYLDSIRNNKADSIAKGATAGARAANDLLAMTENFKARSDNNAQVAVDRYAMVDQQLKADAQARLTARNYFDKLAQSMSTDSIGLYANDTARFGQDHRTNADMYRADQSLRGNRIYANAQMAGAQAQANAAINAAQSGINAQADEYAWIFNSFLQGNNGNVVRAKADMDDYIFKVYSGGTGAFDYMNKLNSK